MQDAMYHRVCLNKLYKPASSLQLGGHFTDRERKLHGIAFGEVVSFIEEIVVNATDTIPALKLSGLIKLYQTSNLIKHRNNARDKNTKHPFQEFFALIEDLSAHNEGKKVILVFNHNIGEVITSAAGINCDDDGYILAKAANVLRRYVGHNDFWIKFRVDGFLLELIFA